MSRKSVSYDALGVSSQKEDVHAAIKDVDQGIFPGAFCKVIPDVFSGDESKCVVFHADGAGTKSIVAYLAWREGGDPGVFHGIAQDALVMNIDDIACVGITSGFVVSNTIGRNKLLVPGEVIASVIEGYGLFRDEMRRLGIEIHLCGGETADVGDLVRTIIVDSTVAVQASRDRIIDASRVQPGDVIVGLASAGRATYEPAENSGISSNGITLARHALLSHDYADRYPEILDPNLDQSLAYRGEFHLEDRLKGSSLTIGEALLSPTRTYVPVLNAFLQEIGNGDGEKGKSSPVDGLHSIIHATGGGQTKCLKFGTGVKYVKDSLFPVPPVFLQIQESGNVEWAEMYRVFNMGHRLEVACVPDLATDIINVARRFNIDAKVIGHVEKNDDGKGNTLEIYSEFGTFRHHTHGKA